MEPEESAPEISPAVKKVRLYYDKDYDKNYDNQVEDEAEPEPTYESFSDCPSAACSRDNRSDRRKLAFKVGDYLMAMAVGALLPELIFYLSQVKKLL